MGGWWITVLGAAAGLCTVGSFVPQVVKAWREGDTNAISLRMYLVLVAGFVLWLGYGLLIGSWPIILVNAGNLVLSAAILRLKLRDSKGTDLGRSWRSWVGSGSRGKVAAEASVAVAEAVPAELAVDGGRVKAGQRG
jgi:MtN3 and saliva related transmembrane protein